MKADATTDTIRFVVPAVPVAQPRPRAAIRAGHATVYGAPSGHAIHAFKASVRMAAKEAYQGPPLVGPLMLVAVFVFPRPSGKVWKTKPMPREPKDTRPDFDNCGKAVCDSLNQLVFADDAQIADCRITKFIAAGDEQAHVEIEITRLDTPA